MIYEGVEWVVGVKVLCLVLWWFVFLGGYGVGSWMFGESFIVI